MDKSIEYIHKNPDKPLKLEVARGAKVSFYQVKPILDKNLKVGLIGFSPRPNYIKVNPFSAIYYGFQQTFSMISLMFVILGKLFSGGISVKDLAGPVGAVAK
ncbi:MAG: hypothetical protein FD145_938 [Candidatus Saganbacteria bacterium]|uniref:Uncharacterized protein n=1 Tax=Candidatus Saganbacteria bacterium TaxID=2575572 RepID=A0A833L0T4_UNCSA|nr:MAG: hypothetical protein FD145_938 [Candidatus Saganbacteria bacterium]